MTFSPLEIRYSKCQLFVCLKSVHMYLLAFGVVATIILLVVQIDFTIRNHLTICSAEP